MATRRRLAGGVSINRGVMCDESMNDWIQCAVCGSIAQQLMMQPRKYPVNEMHTQPDVAIVPLIAIRLNERLQNGSNGTIKTKNNRKQDKTTISKKKKSKGK